MSNAARCQACGIVAPTRFVDFKQNVGMVVLRRSTTVSGYLCKPCVHKHFWKTTGTTLAVGWMSRVSLFIAPVFVVNNVVRYVSVLGMPGVGGADPASRTGKAAAVDALPVMTYTPPPVPVADFVPLADFAPLSIDDEPAAEVELLAPLDPAEVLRPHWAGMVARLKGKEPLDAVAADMAARTGLTAAEVSDYVRDRVRRAKAAKAAAQPAVVPV